MDMENLAGSWKKFVVSCTRALMSVARCIYMVTVSWVNISWFTSQPTKILTPEKYPLYGIYVPYGCVTDVRLINRMAGCSTGWPVDQPACDKTNTYVCAT